MTDIDTIEKIFMFHEKMPRLACKRVRKNICDTCPADGMYGEFSDRLKTKDDSYRRHMSMLWFCHEAPKLACAGNWQIQFGKEIPK